MKVFIIGGSGWIGSAVVAELITKGHSVIGLARSDESANKLTSLGASVVRGGLEDLDIIKSAASSSDAVIHCAYIRDFDNLMRGATVDRQVVEGITANLEGTNKPFIVTSSLLSLATPSGRVSTEKDEPDWASPFMEGPFGYRAKTEQYVLGLKNKGIRSIVIRLASVHGKGDKGFIPSIIQLSKKNGVAGYVGDGENVWPCGHRLDVARLYVLALEKAEPGTALHGVAEKGVKAKDTMAVIGRKLGVEAKGNVAPETLGWLGAITGMNCPSSSEITKKTMGWEPTQKGFLADLEENYF